ncbi:MAG TPA: hypothetical protein VGI40_15575 [Pirellulaceae bacterium]
MLRVWFGAVAALAFLFAGLTSADDTKSKTDSQGKQCCHATITKIAPQKDSITVNLTDKSGKQQEKTFQISKDTELRDSSGKTAKIDDFQTGDDVVLTQKDGKLTQIKENDEATITKVDSKAGTVTLKMKNQDGKDVERVFKLTEDAEYLDSSGRVATLEVFRSGDQVLVIEGEGHIKGLKKSDQKPGDNATASKQRPEDKKSSSK